MTKFEIENRHWLEVFVKEKQQLTRRNARQQRAHMTRSVQLHKDDVLTVPSIALLHALSNYKHDAYTVLLALKSGW